MDESKDRQECLSYSADAMRHRVYRENDPEAMARARWFCQALRNFTAGDAITLIGDDDGLYAWLAQQSGLITCNARPTSPHREVGVWGEALSKAEDERSIAGTVLIGMDAVRGFDSVVVEGQTLLLFVPFVASEQAELNTLLQRVNEIAPVQGHQAVPIGGDKGMLIARCAVGATTGV